MKNVALTPSVSKAFSTASVPSFGPSSKVFGIKRDNSELELKHILINQQTNLDIDLPFLLTY